MRRTLLFLLIFLFACNGWATIYYVDNTMANNGGAGTSWATAKKDVQHAINLATTAGDEVWVKAGTYLPTLNTSGNNITSDRGKTFYLTTTDIKLYGGFAGTETMASQRNPATNVTILSGFLDGFNSANNAYHILRTLNRTSACVVDGFTVQDAKTDLSGFNDNSYGGGMYNGGASPSMSSSPTVSNCIFFHNYGAYGASIANNYGSSPTIINCTFISNVATTVSTGFPPSSNTGFGSGIYNDFNANPTVIHCTFSNNLGSAIYGSGGSPIVSNCTFSNNSFSGMYNNYGSPTVSNCTFISNMGTTSGGGGGMYNNNSSVTVSNCTFSGNTANGGYGGGMYNMNGSVNSPTVTNCIFIGNTATNGGGGMYNNGSNPMISNCTFYGNQGTSSSAKGGGLFYSTDGGGTITNCVLSNNTTPNNNTFPNQVEIYKAGTSTALTVSYSIVDDYSSAATNNYTSGIGIITNNPAFVNTTNLIGPDGIWGTADDGLSITCSSPAKDAGDPAATTPVADIIGNPRKGTMDLGAYEAVGGTTASNTVPVANTAVTIIQTPGTLNYTDCANELLKIDATSPKTLTGIVTVKEYIQSTAGIYSNQNYVRRYYDITPATNANAATATVTCYYTQADFDDYNTNSGGYLSLPTDSTDAANNKINLRITQQHGTSTTGAPNTYTNWGGSGPANVLITPTSVTFNTTASRWEVTFPVTGFSGFFAHTDIALPLPIRLLNFAAKALRNNDVVVSWQTVNQSRDDNYTVERSADGAVFAAIGTIKPTTAVDYKLHDLAPLSGRNYYRLKVTGISGEVIYSEIRSVLIGTNGRMNIYPSPAKDYIVIETSDAYTTATITDMQGRIVYHFLPGTTDTIDIRSWPAGMYILRLATGEVIRFVKE
jgi:hypothetical protein